MRLMFLKTLILRGLAYANSLWTAAKRSLLRTASNSAVGESGVVDSDNRVSTTCQTENRLSWRLIVLTILVVVVLFGIGWVIGFLTGMVYGVTSLVKDVVRGIPPWL